MSKGWDIYDLAMHEQVWASSIGMTITRVPGGWLYARWHYEKDTSGNNNVFVPFDNEFMGGGKDES